MMINKIKQLLICSACVSGFTTAAETNHTDPATRLPSFTVPDGMKAEVWADQSLTLNPSFFSFDSKGRLLISEIYRIYQGVEDIRKFSKEVTVADISIESLDDRIQMYKDYAEQLPKSLYSKASDKIRLVEDSNNDGKADKSTVYADGFNDLLDGLGAGVIERDGKVYYTNMPNLWLLEDNNNDGVSDKRTSLQKGFGTRISFMGHDMHGLAWGPDGRLYWSIGDRGYNFVSKEGNTFFGPNLGAIFRSDPDGANIEVFYHGVRNPQELVFDEYGNLFTADNDGDKGDYERLNHLIEGGDSGWHAGHQSIMSAIKKLELRSYKYTGDTEMPVTWLVNKLSEPRNDKQPAYLLPGIGKFYSGPAGFTYNPSNYLGEQWRNHFFLALFGGSGSRSKITTFKTEKNGASFLMTPAQVFMAGINVTDIDFGPDGRLYASEFNFGGWSNNDEGAIYTVKNTELPNDIKVTHQQYHSLLTANYSEKSIAELSELLAIDHQTIRQRAQFELAKRGEAAVTAFERIAHNQNKDVFSRIHSIWGLSQLVFNHTIDSERLTSLMPLANDANEQVRIQIMRVLGDHAANFADTTFVQALADSNNQVAMYAALGLGKINDATAVPAIINKIIEISDKDLWLRHALTMALKGIDKRHWLKHKNHPSKDVRLALVLTLRMLQDSDIAYFLADQERDIVHETITAIDDKALLAAREQMAQLLSAAMPAASAEQAYIHHRIINANFNQGKLANAERLLTYAATPKLNTRLASEALAAIEGWHDINPIDTITGLPTTANQTRDDINALVNQYLPSILATVQGQALVQAMRIAEQVNFTMSAELLTNIATQTTANASIRIQALNLLAANDTKAAFSLAVKLLDDNNPKINAAAFTKVMQQDKTTGLKVAVNYLKSNSVALKKIVLAQLGKASTPEIDQIIIDKLNALLSGTKELELTLELLEIAKNSDNADVQKLYQSYQNKIKTADIITQFESALAGGDVQTGKEIFYGGGAAQCIRCHMVNGLGSTVGPDLSNIGKHRSATYLLQALVDPSAAIAPGFGNVSLTMKNGDVISGTYQGETETSITLGKTAEKQTVYNKSAIANIQRPVSGMPPMNYLLSQSQIRDLVAFLQSLRVEKSNSH
ncbi:DUF7133 domain-containing protein [Thalassotalea agariperforans]